MAMDKDWRPSERKTYEAPAKRETTKTEPKTEQPKQSKTRFEAYDDSQPSKKYSPPQEHHLPSWWWIPLAIILFIIVVVVLVNNDEETTQPAAETDAQTQEITTLQARLTSCEQTLATKTTQPAAPAEECAGLTETAYQALKRDLDTLQKADKTNKATIADQQKTIADAARRICCAQRVENNNIKGYEIKSNKITCVENGGEQLSC